MAYLGYATFYLVRNNLGVVAKEMGAALHYDKSDLGNILAASAMAYGVGKFLMGYLSDRSDSRKFIAAGLLLMANFAFGAVTHYWLHLALWTLNGLIPGHGTAPAPARWATGIPTRNGARFSASGTRRTMSEAAWLG